MPDTTYTIHCDECGAPMTFLDWREHVHVGPAPELLAVLLASVRP